MGERQSKSLLPNTDTKQVNAASKLMVRGHPACKAALISFNLNFRHHVDSSQQLEPVLSQFTF
jgi:hypothetical protein